MNDYRLVCYDERRRRQVRKSGMNGLDYVEVSEDQTRLSVYFINSAPEGLDVGNFHIEGGQRITNIEIIGLEYGCKDEQDPELDVCVQLTVNRPGDYSTYRLCWVEADEHGYSTSRRHGYADPRYACLEFSFKANCVTGLDCKDETPCPPAVYDQPDINYLARDYASFRQLILDRLSLTMPAWKESHVPDIGIALVELLAYVGDYLSYYQDAVATEAYLETARQRISVRRHTRLVDYAMHEGCNARVWVCVTTVQNVDLDSKEFYFITGYNERLRLPEGTAHPAQLADIQPTLYEVFHPLTSGPIHFNRDHNEIYFYTWGNQQCCLAKGATRATLLGRLAGVEQPEINVDREPDSKRVNRDREDWHESHRQEPQEQWVDAPELHLRVGDILIFEEVIGPETGNPADADPTHRQAVRLTRVRQEYDSAYNLPVVEIEWAEEDALAFALCISTIGPAPECALIENISIARGNVVLADHGRWLPRVEPLGKTPVIHSITACEAEDDPTDTVVSLGRLKPPPLTHTPVTFRQTLPGSTTPASRMLTQDPRKALPQVELVTHRRNTSNFYEEDPTSWQPELDLLASGPLDEHFAVEIDNKGRAYLRFGDGVQGRIPPPTPLLYARYRVGNGAQGNVGADAINRVVTEQRGVSLSARNPLPARGGIDPEPMEAVKLFAPGAFRSERKRAITPEDYVWLAKHGPDQRVVQHAAAALRWTGSWYEMLVALDPPGDLDAGRSANLAEVIKRHLEDYRRIGHDLEVKLAQYAYLDIEMCVTVLPQFFRGHVKQALLDTFSNRRLPNGRLGFFHPDNLTFGDGIYVSKLIAAAQAVQGVECVWVRRLQHMFDPVIEGQESPAIADGVLPLGPLEVARVDNDPNFEGRGRIVFMLEGGR